MVTIKSWELCFIRLKILGLKPRHHLKESWENCSKREPGYIEVFQQRTGSLNIKKKVLLIKGKQVSWVKEFSTVLCMGRCKSLGSLKSFLSYESQLSGTSILWFSHHELPWAQYREWLQSDGSEITDTFPLPECP